MFVSPRGSEEGKMSLKELIPFLSGRVQESTVFRNTDMVRSRRSRDTRRSRDREDMCSSEDVRLVKGGLVTVKPF